MNAIFVIAGVGILADRAVIEGVAEVVAELDGVWVTEEVCDGV